MTIGTSNNPGQLDYRTMAADNKDAGTWWKLANRGKIDCPAEQAEKIASLFNYRWAIQSNREEKSPILRGSEKLIPQATSCRMQEIYRQGLILFRTGISQA